MKGRGRPTRLQPCFGQCFSFSLLFPSGRGGRRCPSVRPSPSHLTQLFFVPADKGENGEPYQRRKGAGASLPDGPPAFPAARDGAPTAGSSSWRRIMLMILAITIHNIPGGSCPSVHPPRLAGSLCPVPSWEGRAGLPPSLPPLFLPDGTRPVGARLPFGKIHHVKSCSLGWAEPCKVWAAKPPARWGLGGSPWAGARGCVLNIRSPIAIASLSWAKIVNPGGYRER